MGQTSFVVVVTWGAGSQSGLCVPNPEIPDICHVAARCRFGAYSVKVTGQGIIQWRDPVTGAFGRQIKLDGEAKTYYGNAAVPVEKQCGDGSVGVYFPDDLAGGGPVCTACN